MLFFSREQSGNIKKIVWNYAQWRGIYVKIMKQIDNKLLR
jgi:hypothetical protein